MRKLALSMLLLVGCAAPQRPISFSLAPRAGDPVDAVVRELALAGLAATSVDRQTGIVRTAWQDTGYLYGQLNGVTASIVRRYAVIVAAGASGVEVTVRADTQRCAQGTFNVLTPDGGVCEGMDGLVPRHQEELNALAARLRADLGS